MRLRIPSDAIRVDGITIWKNRTHITFSGRLVCADRLTVYAKRPVTASQLERIIRSSHDAQHLVTSVTCPWPVYRVLVNGELKPSHTVASLVTILAKGADMYAGDWPHYQYAGRHLTMDWRGKMPNAEVAFRQ